MKTPTTDSDRDDALEVARRLREVAARLGAHAAEPADQDWLHDCFLAYLDAPDNFTLDEAFALDTPHGSLPWRRQEALAARNEELRLAAAEHFADREPGEQAAALHAAWIAYERGRWPHDRDADSLPARIAQSLRGRLWSAAKRAPLPRSKRQIKRALMDTR